MIPVLIVPVLNRYDLLKRMLDSIDYPVEKLIIIDNADPSHFEYKPNKDLIKNFYHLKFPSNLGVPASWNLGIKMTPFTDYWLIVNNDAWFPEGSLAKFAEVSAHDKLILSAQEPPWCAFTIGKNYIIRVGLFDEGIYPAYFEDNDYVRRCQRADLPIYKSDIAVNHDNSSTLQEGHQEDNSKTYVANMVYYDNKVKSNDYSEGHWSLLTRLQNSWD
jgi:GT2 family glycosyltransferase